jgi:hypothetical protein
MYTCPRLPKYYKNTEILIKPVSFHCRKIGKLDFISFHSILGLFVLRGVGFETEL